MLTPLDPVEMFVRSMFPADEVVAHVARVADRDAYTLRLTSMNYTNREIDGITIHKAKDDLPALMLAMVESDLLALADQLEWAAKKIREAA